MGNVPPSAAASNGVNTNQQTTTPHSQSHGQQVSIETNNNTTTTTINDGTNDNSSAEVNTNTYINEHTPTHGSNNNNNNNNNMVESFRSLPPVTAPINNDVKVVVCGCGNCNELNSTNNNNTTPPSCAPINIRAAPSNTHATAAAAASSSGTSLLANDDSLYPTAYPNKANELMSLVGDPFIDPLVVDMDFDKDLVCSVLANYNYNGFEDIEFKKWHEIIYECTIKQSERDNLNQSLSDINQQSPNRGNTNDTNNTRRENCDNDDPGGVTDSMSKLRSPSGAVHSPMKSPTHNSKRLKQRTSNGGECDNTSTQNTSIGTNSIDICDTAPQINRTATTQTTAPFIKSEGNADAIGNTDIELRQYILNNPTRYLTTVKQETRGGGESPLRYTWQYDRGGGASSRSRSMPQNNNGRNSATNNNRSNASTAMGSNLGSNFGSNSLRSNSNQTANVAAVTNSNQSSNGQASVATKSHTASSVDSNNSTTTTTTTTTNNNTYTHPCTLESLLWSSEDSNTSSNSHAKSQSQLPLDCYDDPDIDGDDSAMDRLCQLMNNHFEEAEQLLGHRVDNVDDLLRLLEERLPG